ncbi:MAG: DUF1232 domain-containing protein [Bacteroidales bacterium]|nr:DUF1232 domain-containing protein [Bacteroidales bacterium]
MASLKIFGTAALSEMPELKDYAMVIAVVFRQAQIRKNLETNGRKEIDMSDDLEKRNVSHVGAWIWVVIGIIYAISPIDLLPDAIPVAGWVDDILITVTSGLNLIQSYLKETNEHLAKIVKGIKWVLIVLGILVIAVIALVVVGIAHLFA